MDRNEILSLFVTALAVVLGLSMVTTHPVAAICLVIYGLLVGLRTFSEPIGTIIEAYPKKVSFFKLLLLLLALVDLFF